MKNKSVGLLELETAVLECFWEKTPLSLLGVNRFFADTFGIQLVIFPKAPVHNTLTAGSPRTLVPTRDNYSKVSTPKCNSYPSLTTRKATVNTNQ
jgi:hypothetical protein